MKKTLFFLGALFCSAISTAQITDAAPYCTPTFANNYNMMNRFKIDGAVVQDFGAPGTRQSEIPFRYYNTVTLPNMTMVSSYNFDIGFYNVNDGEPIYFTVWIDFNKNNTFEASEIVMQNSNTTNAALPTFGGANVVATQIVKNVSIPTSATPGVTRLRIMRGMNFASPYSAYSATFVQGSCPGSGSNAYGNTYDFNVNIVAGLATDEVSKNNYGISLYPNPASDVLFIRDKNLPKNNTVSIVNQVGQKVISTVMIAEEGIDVSDLKKGVYFVEITNGKTKKSTKFIKK